MHNYTAVVMFQTTNTYAQSLTQIRRARLAQLKTQSGAGKASGAGGGGGGGGQEQQAQRQ